MASAVYHREDDAEDHGSDDRKGGTLHDGQDGPGVQEETGRRIQSFVPRGVATWEEVRRVFPELRDVVCPGNSHNVCAIGIQKMSQILSRPRFVLEPDDAY